MATRNPIAPAAITSQSSLTSVASTLHEQFAFAVVTLFGFAVGFVACTHFYFESSVQLTGENGFLENMQQLLLSLAGIAFAIHVLSPRSSQPRIRSLGLLALCTTFLLRETDVAVPDQIDWLTFWVDETGKKILVASTWAMVVCFAISHRDWRTCVKSSFVFDTTFWSLALAAVTLSIGWAFDRGHVKATQALLIEEQSEVVGYTLMLFAAVQFTSVVSQLTMSDDEHSSVAAEQPSLEPSTSPTNEQLMDEQSTTALDSFRADKAA